MTTDSPEALGPIDFVVIEFDGAIGDEPAAELIDLVAQGVITVYDVAVIRRDADGNVAAVEITPDTADTLGGLRPFAGLSSGLLAADDIAAAGEVLEPGCSGVVLVFENTWAASFAVAARRAGGQLAAFERIPTQTIVARLDQLGDD